MSIKIDINFFVFNVVLSMHNLTFKCNLQCTCNILFIKTIFIRDWSFSLNSKKFFDDTLQLLIFLSAKSFHKNTLHSWKCALDINWYLYFCLFGSHLPHIFVYLITFDHIFVIWLYFLIPPVYLKVFSIINNFNFTFLICFFAVLIDFNHFIHIQKKDSF